MIRTRFFIALFVFALAGASASAGDTNATFKKWLNGFNKQAAAAYARKDASFFDKCTTADFSYTDAMGKKEDKKTSMMHMKEMFAMSESVKAGFKILGTSVKGNTATANFQGSFTIVSKPGEDGKKHKMDMTAFTIESYKKSGKGWLIQKIVETKPGKWLMDGKPFDPSKMGGR